MPWPSKCTAKSVQCSVCGAANAHPGSNGVHLCDKCALEHIYWCKHCSKIGKHFSSVYETATYECPHCHGLLCSKCFDKVAAVSPYSPGYTPQAAAYEESTKAQQKKAFAAASQGFNYGKIEAIKILMDASDGELKLAEAKANVDHIFSLPSSKAMGLWDKELAYWKKKAASKQGVVFHTTTGKTFKEAGKTTLTIPKKLPDGFLTKPKPKATYLFHPNAEQKEEFAEWGLEPMLNLTQEAADYYLLALMDTLQDDSLGINGQFKGLIAKLDDQFQKYLHMAIGGELRHFKHSMSGGLSKYAPQLVALFKQHHMDGGRHDAWLAWKGFADANGWEKSAGWAADMFNKGHWTSGFGGEKWGAIAVCLQQRLKGDLTPMVFVDTAFGLQHNGGIVFNKKTGWAYNGLQKVLDAGRAVDFDKPWPMQVLVDYGSEDVTLKMEQALANYVGGKYDTKGA